MMHRSLDLSNSGLNQILNAGGPLSGRNQRDSQVTGISLLDTPGKMSSFHESIDFDKAVASTKKGSTSTRPTLPKLN